MGKRNNIQNLLDIIDKENVDGNITGFDAACQKLGLEIYRRSLRKNMYKIIVENPRK